MCLEEGPRVATLWAKSTRCEKNEVGERLKKEGWEASNRELSAPTKTDKIKQRTCTPELFDSSKQSPMLGRTLHRSKSFGAICGQLVVRRLHERIC
jgi:hypothetical protein